jgi:hypothetical protein
MSTCVLFAIYALYQVYAAVADVTASGHEPGPPSIQMQTSDAADRGAPGYGWGAWSLARTSLLSRIAPA